MVEDTKICPFCAEEIKAAATKCKHCGSDLHELARSKEKKERGSQAAIGCLIILSLAAVFYLVSLFLPSTPVRPTTEPSYPTGVLSCRDCADAGMEILARNNLKEPILATPAIIENKLYVRTAQHLYAFAEP